MTEPSTIAIVCLPGLGGSSIVASELARHLAARGHRVVVVASALPERLKVNGVRFERVDVPCSPVLDHGPYGVALAGHLVELVRRERIDLVHLHYAVPHAASAMMAAAVLGDAAPPFVVTLHGTDVTRLGCHPSIQPVLAFALDRCGGITAPSRFLRDEATRCFGLAASRIDVISNFVDTARFAPPAQRDPQVLARLFGDTPGGPVLFHVSNFRPIKRTMDLVALMERLRQTLPARMVLVGDGPERATVERAAIDRGLGDAMRFLGKRNDFESLLGHGDGFVLTSESESFGLAALEAMAAGLPVHAYDVGGLPEVVDHASGTLVPLGDVDALAAAVRATLPDRDVRGRAARARALDAFRSDRVLAAYEAHYRAVLHGRGRS